MWPSFARLLCDIHVHVFAARVKHSKVWAHVTKLSDSVRCNICSSEILNKGGNISNIMKHLLTKHNIYLKQCAVFTMFPVSNCNSRDTFTSNVDSAVTLTRLHLIAISLFRAHKLYWSVRTLKGRSNSTWLLSYLSYRLIALILSKTHTVYI